MFYDINLIFVFVLEYPQQAKFETKISSIWHNVKYGWSSKLRQNFSKGICTY
jgi:hypothetical protein